MLRRMPRKPSKPLLGSRRRRLALALVLGGFLLLVGWLFIGPFWRLTSEFDDLTYRQPSRLYARPVLLETGKRHGRDLLIADLRNEGYRAVDGDRLTPGRYRAEGGTVTIHLRSFRLPDGGAGGGLLEVRFKGDRVTRLRRGETAVEAAYIEPPLIASYYGSDFKERRPVQVDQLPEDLIHAVLAAEDDAFFRHSGLSFSGMARAAWVNARGRQLRQGGSTLTQQLVKNLYLTQERTLTRKSQEIVLSVLLELRYGKREILEAYLNEIYLGASNGVNLLGVGAAARAFFGKDATQLGLAEAATLAGVISSPASYSPSQHPERSRKRRDWVLARMVALKLVEESRARAASAAPLSLAPEPVVRRRAPYFADAMVHEAARRFGVDDLADGGYVLVSTLDWKDQQAAHKTIADTLPELDKREARKDKGSPLQAALVSVEPQSGGIRAYVGGRRYVESQFDRASQARRQAGSVFKPVVYAAVFEARSAMPASFVEDTPLTVKVAGGKPWSPKNDDGDFHGWVTVRSALERSYNPATARLALEVGMDKVVALAREMGVVSPLAELPSMALGAAEVTPVELAAVYATLASGGVRPPVHGLTAVFDRYGKPVPGTALAERERVLSPQSAYLVTSLLQGVIERGTGRAARAQGVRGELAGKTGTTNKRRDAWFAGYAPERATVVWVGYDDNAPTRLSGARAALPIWSRFTAAVGPPGGYSAFRQPAGITTAAIDPSTGLLATEFCPGVITEVFRDGESPTELCDRHQGWLPEQMAEAGEAGMDPEADGDDFGEAAREERGERRGNAISRWFRRVFGEDGRPEEEKPPGNR